MAQLATSARSKRKDTMKGGDKVAAATGENPRVLMVRAGILLVDKPGGITSHDVVARARRALGTRKIGHAGTLDPMATGLLVLGVEGATRLLTYIVGADKTYEATILLGASTDSDDADGVGDLGEGPVLLLHGSTGGGLFLDAAGEGVPVSVTVTHVDGLVFAASTFESSANYRSAVVFGTKVAGQNARHAA